MSIPHLGDDNDVVIPVDTGKLAFLVDALRKPLPAGHDIVIVTIPAPPDSLENFLRVVRLETGFIFRSYGGMQIAGGGSAAAVTAAGDTRFATARDAAEELWSRISVRVFPGCWYTPVVVGAFSFMPGVPDVTPWPSFVPDAFTLARWTYRREGNRAHLSCAATSEELAVPGAAEAFAKEASRILGKLDADSPTSIIHRSEIPRSAVHEMTLGDWTSYIDAIHAAMATGRFDKLVAARRSVVDLPEPVDDLAAIARLSAAYPECTHFALRRHDATFFGATPETLFKKNGHQLTTEALAGTMRVSDDTFSDSSTQVAALKGSSKNLVEHAMVVKTICQELWPLSKRTRYSATPQARRVRHLLHLRTPISCELRDGVTAFDLISALHPTAAVGGFPAKPAASWIRDNEPIERGLYSGTIGWFDAKGDAEIAVAIRCGVITRKRAFIYGGAGIVKDSSAESEYDETAAKMIPILRALGVSRAL